MAVKGPFFGSAPGTTAGRASGYKALSAFPSFMLSVLASMFPSSIWFQSQVGSGVNDVRLPTKKQNSHGSSVEFAQEPSRPALAAWRREQHAGYIPLVRIVNYNLSCGSVYISLRPR